jgi:hypothetical protein
MKILASGWTFFFFYGASLLPSPAQPALSIQQAQNQALTVTWPASATNFILESASELSDCISWKAVAETPMLGNNQYSATLQATGHSRFFHLYQMPAVNLPPQFCPIGVQSVTAGRLLSVDLRATDPNRQPLTFSADPLPANASFAAAAARFTFLPGIEQVGEQHFTFHVSDGSLSNAVTMTVLVNFVALHIERLSPGSVQFSWDNFGSEYDQFVECRDSLAPEVVWQRLPGGPHSPGLVATYDGSQRFFRLIALPRLTRVTAHTPLAGATEVGVTVTPQVYFSKPIDPATLDTNNFYATFARQRIPARVVPSGDGTFAWLFLTAPMQGGSRIEVTLEGANVRAAGSQLPLDAAAEGTGGSVLRFSFTTVSVTPVPGTVLAGRIVDPGRDLRPRTIDDIRFNVGGLMFLLPIAGVKVSLVGLEDGAVFTDSNGWFRLDPVPVGDVKVVVDGRTAVTPHPDFYWPEMVMDSRTAAGRTNYITMIGQETNALPLFLQTVYLPRIASNVLQTVNAGGTTLITLQSNAAYDLPPEQQPNLSLQIMPNSLVGLGGQPLTNAQVGISVVAPELVRDMLPPGVLAHTFDITVQAPGICKFSSPAPMSFPNVFGAEPGTQLNFLSFDHTTGRLVIEGTATVSGDGLSVRTDPGTGITHPGWHGLTPPGGPNDLPCRPTKYHNPSLQPSPVFDGLRDYLLTNDEGIVTLSFGNAAPRAPGVRACDPANLIAVPLMIEFSSDDWDRDFLEGDALIRYPLALYPGQQHTLRLKPKRLLTAEITFPRRQPTCFTGRRCGLWRGPETAAIRYFWTKPSTYIVCSTWPMTLTTTGPYLLKRRWWTGWTTSLGRRTFNFTCASPAIRPSPLMRWVGNFRF